MLPKAKIIRINVEFLELNKIKTRSRYTESDITILQTIPDYTVSRAFKYVVSIIDESPKDEKGKNGT